MAIEKSFDLDFETGANGFDVCEGVGGGSGIICSPGQEIALLGKCSGRCNKYSTTHSRVGSQSMRVFLDRLDPNITGTDPQNNKYRAEIVPRHDGFRNGPNSYFGTKEYLYRVSIYLPSTYEYDYIQPDGFGGDGDTFFQFHQSVEAHQNPFALKVQEDYLLVQNKGTGFSRVIKLPAFSATKEVWHDFVVHVLWDWNGSMGGFLKVWHQGVLIADWTGRNCDEEPIRSDGTRAGVPWPKCGLYRTVWRNLRPYNENISVREFWLDKVAGMLGTALSYSDIALTTEATPDVQPDDPDPTPDPDPVDSNPDLFGDVTADFVVLADTSLANHVPDTDIDGMGFMEHGGAQTFNILDTEDVARPTGANAFASFYMGSPQQNVQIDINCDGNYNRPGIYLRSSEDGLSGYRFFVAPGGEVNLARRINGVFTSMFIGTIPGGLTNSETITIRAQVTTNSNGDPVIKLWARDVADTDTPLNGDGNVDTSADAIKDLQRAGFHVAGFNGTGPTFNNLVANQIVLPGLTQALTRLDPAQDITPSQANMREVRSGNFIPVDAVGGILRIHNTSSIQQSFAYALSGGALTDIRLRPSAMGHYFIPFSSIGDFDLRVTSLELKVELIAWCSPEHNTIYQEGTPLTFVTDGTWQNVDLSAEIAGDTPSLAIIEINTGFGKTRLVDIRANGSIDENYSDQNGVFQYIVPLDVNNIFQIKAEDVNVTAKLMGFIQDSVTTNTDLDLKAPVGTDYEPFAAAATSDGVLLHVGTNAGSGLTIGTRATGKTTQDIVNAIPANRAGFRYVPVRKSDQQYDLKRSSSDVYFGVLAEITAIAATPSNSSIVTIDNADAGCTLNGTWTVENA